MACDPASDPSVRLLSGFGYEWASFNHRLSHLQAEVADDSVTTAVVGGTSTTGAVPVLGDDCDPDTCKEFPLTDIASIHVNSTTLSDPALVVARARVTLEVGPDGGDARVELPWERAPTSFTPVLAGIVLDGAGASGACYNAAFGWLPTHIAVAVEAEGAAATVHAAFASGVSLEDERACLDAAAPEGTAVLTVDVLGIAGVNAESASFEQSATWNEDGSAYAAQTPPAAAAVDLPDARAFTALEWRFHVDDANGRGAYLRTLDFGGEGVGTATNYSPGTQKSGFDFVFAGTVAGFVGSAATSTHMFEYQPELTDDGTVVAAIEAEAD